MGLGVELWRSPVGCSHLNSTDLEIMMNWKMKYLDVQCYVFISSFDVSTSF